MNLLELFHTFRSQERALEYLEEVRWRGRPICSYCGSDRVGRHASGDRSKQRWQCRTCNRAFAATVGTLFHGTHVPLQKWFLLIAEMLNAKASESSHQMARNLGMRRPTVGSMMSRVRSALASDPEQARLLYGIVGVDESHIGASLPEGNHKDNIELDKHDRGIKRTPMIGFVELGGRTIVEPADSPSKSPAKLVGRFINRNGKLLNMDK